MTHPGGGRRPPFRRPGRKPGRDSRLVLSDRAAEPVGPYPHARVEGEWIFVSGVGPRQRGKKEIPGTTLDAEGRVVDHDVAVQTRATIANVRMILEDAGAGLADVVDVTVYLTDMARDFATFNKVYDEHFGPIRPTRTTLGITALPTPIAVELKVVARTPAGARNGPPRRPGPPGRPRDRP